MGIARARQFRKQMPASEASLWNALRSLKPLGLHREPLLTVTPPTQFR
jgi:very-short-patch-repair endonuclease